MRWNEVSGYYSTCTVMIYERQQIILSYFVDFFLDDHYHTHTNGILYTVCADSQKMACYFAREFSMGLGVQ